MDKREIRSKLLDEMKALNEQAKAETRSFNDDEKKLYEEKAAEVRKLTAEIEAEEREATLNGFNTSAPKLVVGDNNAPENREAQEFAQTGHAEIRSVLATGNIAKPSAAGSEISGLAAVADSIVDDVHAIPLTGTGAWVAPYKKTNASAAAVTDGSAVGGSGSTYDYVTINPSEWGILDEVSKQVKKMSPANYLAAVSDSALIALRDFAADKIITAVTNSNLKQAKTYTLDAQYVRKAVTGFRAIKGKGPVMLYISQGDLATLGGVRGTNEKKAVYEIEYKNEELTSGIIKDGGTAVKFRILDGLTDGTQLFGQPGAIDMPMWDNYSIETDEHGDYFKRNVMGVRGLQTAGVDLVAKNGMQVISNSTT